MTQQYGVGIINERRDILMSKRRHGDKQRATTVGEELGRVVRLSADPPGGLTLAQLQAERMAEIRFTEMMAAAGVDHGRMSLEVLYYLPRDFLNAYAEVFHFALVGDDGGSDAQGRRSAQDGALGKAKGSGKQLKGRRYKRYWTVQDEDALNLKSAVDKRLRAIGRDMRGWLSALESGQADKSIEGSAESARARCPQCGRLVAMGWKYCAGCGENLLQGEG